MHCVSSPRQSTQNVIRRIRWERPPSGWKKLNTDGSCIGNSRRSGCGGAVRDEHGEWIVGFSRYIGTSCSVVAELWGLRDRLVLCKNLNIQCLVVELDTSMIVDALTKPEYANNIIPPILDDCRQLLTHFQQVQIRHCFRQANRCIDMMARKGAEQQLDFCVFKKLVGNLPKSVNLSSLQRVYLDFNHLEGSLPLWPNVTAFSLRSNLLSGPIPIRIGQEMSQLVELDLSDNFLNGSIPSSINGLRALGSLRLLNNCLSGNIHNHWQGMLNLFFIDLSINNLSGGIPSSMCSLPYLSWLQLSNNNLFGNLSLGLKFLSRQISTLDFEENRLSGTIPTWVGERNFSIKILHLRGNMLYGKIPKQLCGLTNIHVLDLAHNNFSGSIPTHLGSLVGYKDSNVVDHMNIPRYMDLVVKGRQYEYYDEIFFLKIMDFSRNNLSGEIPVELTSLTLLNSLNLSGNQLIGKIPENIGSLRQLETLDLSSNHLSGHIPPSMSSMTFLSHLNLSYNNLSGPIPSANQFQTFNDPSIYEGNPQLYGPPPMPTSLSMPSDRNAEHKNGEGQFEKLWLYLSIALGFIVGFWAVCGSLLINKSWRNAYFCFADEMKDGLLVIIAVNMAHLQRKIQAERH
ncbi:hypothetical protein SO802_012108 [Lithocarpus litseifolius]|uniref:RNase H type-1 domain-containing protein n=1 Tax=Lithocarpus litseifolius TaxID=425828 RepID=A0AAW2D3Z2_9ROSI